MGKSSPVNAPTPLQEKLDILSIIDYSSITYDSTSSSDDAYDVSYGSENLPAICEYGKKNQNLFKFHNFEYILSRQMLFCLHKICNFSFR